MKKQLSILLTLVLAALAHAGIVDDINYSNAPGGGIVNARSIAQDSIFHSCGAVFEGSLKEDGVRFRGGAVLIAPNLVLSAKHVFEKWDEEKPTHQFFFGFPKDPAHADISPENFRAVSKLVGFKGQDMVLVYLDMPITTVAPAQVISKEDFAVFLQRVLSSYEDHPGGRYLSGEPDKRICGMFASYSGDILSSDVRCLGFQGLNSLLHNPPLGSPKSAGAIQLRHYNETTSLLCSNFVDFPAEGRQDPFLFKGLRAPVVSPLPGGSGSGLFFEIKGEWKLVALAESVRPNTHPLTQILPGIHMLLSEWSPIRLSPDRLEKAIIALEQKRPLFRRA